MSFSPGERDRELLLDILEYGEEALRYLRDVPLARFLEDRMLRLALERLVEIIGEAAGHLSIETKESIRYDWRAVRGLRNILAHQYDSVDPKLLYTAAVAGLPELLEEIRGLLADQESG